MNKIQRGKSAGSKAALIQADQVIAYLKDHPDFLDKHPQILQALEIPHPRAVGTLSLLERQTALLKEELSTVRAQLKHIKTAAEFNYYEQKKLHTFILALLACRSNRAIGQLFEEKFTAEFKLEQSKMLLWKKQPKLKQQYAQLLRYLDDEGVFCGQLPQPLADHLMIQSARSVALLALGEDASCGLLIFSAADERFLETNISKLLLGFIGKITTQILR